VDGKAKGPKAGGDVDVDGKGGLSKSVALGFKGKGGVGGGASVSGIAGGGKGGTGFKIGSKVSAKWSGDGNYYNAIIDGELEEGGKKYYNVKFPDYGNTEKVAAGDIKLVMGAGAGAGAGAGGGLHLGIGGLGKGALSKSVGVMLGAKGKKEGDESSSSSDEEEKKGKANSPLVASQPEFLVKRTSVQVTSDDLKGFKEVDAWFGDKYFWNQRKKAKYRLTVSNPVKKADKFTFTISVENSAKVRNKCFMVWWKLKGKKAAKQKINGSGKEGNFTANVEMPLPDLSGDAKITLIVQPKFAGVLHVDMTMVIDVTNHLKF